MTEMSVHNIIVGKTYHRSLCQIFFFLHFCQSIWLFISACHWCMKFNADLTTSLPVNINLEFLKLDPSTHSWYWRLKKYMYEFNTRNQQILKILERPVQFTQIVSTSYFGKKCFYVRNHNTYFAHSNVYTLQQ